MFESSVELTPEQIGWLNRCSKKRWELNPTTGLVDVGISFSCSGQKLRDFKGVKFGVIKGNFRCTDNNLTSLDGAPREVLGDFVCSGNKITSLEGAPQKVVGAFNCSDNQLTSLEGAPPEFTANFNCKNNNLTTLKGAPQKVEEYFACDHNNLTTLEGAPQKVGGYLSCSDNQLTSLEGAPQEILFGLYCGDNPVSAETLKSIFRLMKKSESYLKAVESLWPEIPVEDQALLYRPEFEWVGADEVKKLDALRAYQGFKGMI